jgi:hypothetical protein
VLANQPSKRREAPGHLSTSKLRDVAQSRMWKWLFDAHRLLGVTVEVVDDRLNVLSIATGGGLLGRDPDPTEGSLQDAVGESLTTATPTTVTSGGYQVSCTPIVIGGAVGGAVLVGAEASRLGDRDLARAGLLLANSLEDELSHPVAEHADSLHKIAAFYQLLHTAIASGSDREVVRTFAEALSVWDEIEVFAYRADLDGRFALEVSLPGSDVTAGPREIDASPFPVGAGLSRLSAHDRQDLGFTGPGETAIVHLAADGGPWVIAMTAAHNPAEAERSELYVAALAHAVNAALGVETARLTWAVMQQFVDSQSPHDAAVRALKESAVPLNADGRFAVFGAHGVPILAVGDGVGLDPTLDDVAELRTLRSHVSTNEPYAAVLEMRAVGRAFTRRDVRLFEAAAANFGTWLPSAIRRIDTDPDRRVVARSFDQILDGYVRAAHASNDSASLVLLSSGEAPLSLQAAHTWIRAVRPQLRPTDLAGRLTSGEVGILLLETPQPGAQVVARRLARVFEARPQGSEPAVRIGVASQAADAASAAALIERARSHTLVP